MLGSCQKYSFEECVKIHGLDSGRNVTEDEIDAELLCGVKSQLVVELVSAGAVAIVAYIITNFYIQVTECSVLLKKSRIWGKGKPHAKEANRAIVYSTILNGVVGFFFYVISVAVINILTHPLDNRTNQFVVGVSQVFAAIVFLMMSIHVPQWIGIYHSNKNTMISYTSGRGIRFNLTWNLWKQLISMYFFALYFACADFELSLVWGALIGFVVGVFSILLTMAARSKQFAHQQKLMASMVIIFYVILSWYVLYAGVDYIANIWMKNEDQSNVTSFLISLAWVVVMIVTHLLVLLWTNEKKKQGASMRFISQHFKPEKLKNIYLGAQFSRGNGDESIDAETAKKDAMSAEQPVKEQETGDEANLKKNKSRVTILDDKSIDEKKTAPKFALYVSPEDAPSCWKLWMNKIAETYPSLCCCLEKKYGVENISQRRLDYIDHAREKSKVAKLFNGLRRFFWYLCSFACFFFTIVNIGATYQQCAAKNALQDTFELLYPPDYLNATMCAWDAPGPNATIKTFDTSQDVYDAGYEVIHCGACGRCSNWNDITLQYTSRKYLAAIGKVCAKKSIGRSTNVSDPNDPVVMCNRLLVGFTPPCAMSWAWDMVNTKNNAMFVFLQAQLSNFATDMEVTYQDITMATIDEAISGPRFVQEVGATRRRMNIISGIRRPISQQCTVITQNWTEIFVEPFKPPVGGTYRVETPGNPVETVVIIGQDSDPS
eukprot:CAMPEP_0116119378 /NCGR_PEP_ID=MMETSP0329-20121206/2606_1 /TAXON_ID=697910 /ORGANISM="Pseudo-nitzschia arenysensis, Strain B593" /LENGTH=715 /DNA_ID=CAMNT_0003613069 /DNA_START=48 /DNA_END=2195 /DNA_ORIENTATION=-